ncbi:MAG TPA: hypothetical protein VGG71_02375 [Chitinophagaceae bacterium]
MKTGIVLSLLILILFSSCAKNIKDPEYRDIRNVRLITLGLLQSTAGADIVYYNPNKVGVLVESATGDIYVDNNLFGQFEVSDKVEVKKRSEFILPTLVKIDMASVIKNRDVYKQKQAMVRIEGTATVKKAGFSKNVPIKYESMQDIEKFKSLVVPQQ